MSLGLMKAATATYSRMHMQTVVVTLVGFESDAKQIWKERGA